MNSIDNDKIKQVCKNLVGCEINIGFKIKLQNGKVYKGEIDDCNIVGNSMETILYSLLKKEISTILRGPKQHSPDFFNNDYENKEKLIMNIKRQYEILTLKY